MKPAIKRNLKAAAELIAGAALLIGIFYFTMFLILIFGQ